MQIYCLIVLAPSDLANMQSQKLIALKSLRKVK